MRAHLVRKTYRTGVKVPDAQMRELRLTPDSSMPKWNYTMASGAGTRCSASSSSSSIPAT